jgi:hypothetical protein
VAPLVFSWEFKEVKEKKEIVANNIYWTKMTLVYVSGELEKRSKWKKEFKAFMFFP